MWTTIYMSQDLENIRSTRLKIEEKSIIVMFHRIHSEELQGLDCYELLVPSAELNDALEIIID
jgi:hypothetical protein